MRAGRLNQRVTILQRTLAQDEYGAKTPEWSELTTVWATLTNITGSEQWANEQVLNASSIAFRIRYQAGLSKDMRLVHNGITYQITTIIDPYGRNKELIITARDEQ